MLVTSLFSSNAPYVLSRVNNEGEIIVEYEVVVEIASGE